MRWLLSSITPLLGLPLLLSACAAPVVQAPEGATPERAMRVETHLLPGVQRLIERRRPADAVPAYEALVAAGAPAQVIFSEENGSYDQMRRQTVSGDGVETWLLQNGRTVAMQDGMLVATRGLGRDIMAADGAQTRALLAAGQEGQVEHFLAYPDGNNGIEFEAFVCDVERFGEEELDLVTRRLVARRMTETCYGPDFGFFNIYWMDPRDGRIWQSRQFVSTLVGMVDFRLMTPESLSGARLD